MLQTVHKRIWTRILVMTLALALCVGLAMPALASEITGNEANPATAYITKSLQMPEGTDTPNLGFRFTFTKKAWNDDTTATADMPVINDLDIVYGPTITVDESTDPAMRVKTVLNQRAIPFPNPAVVPSELQRTGVYTYTVIEQQILSSGSLGTAAPKETLVFSQAEYEISFFVKEKTDGSGDLYVSSIVVKATKDDNGDPIPNTPKVDAGDGKHGLRFTNIYTKTNGDPTDPTVDALSISKKVTGDFAEQTRYFAFDVTLTKPGVFSTEQTYKAYVLDASGAVVTNADNVGGNASLIKPGGYIEFTTGAPQTIYLKHGQKLAFNDLTVGAKYVAVEQGVTSYTPSAKLVVAGTGISPDLSGGEGQSLTTTDRLVGEGANSAAFTNEMRNITPTGILLDNLPFIVILALAAGAFALFLVVKIRQKNRYASNE